MFYVLRTLISVLTFPGVIVHELAHQIFCHLCRVPVYKVKYFQFKNPPGYVIHAAVDRPIANFAIGTGPFLINTVLGVSIALPATAKLADHSISTLFSTLFSTLEMMDFILIYLGFAILMHAFPSKGDAQSMYRSIVKNKRVNILAKILALPIIGLIYLGSLGSIIWLDTIYAIALLKLSASLLPPLWDSLLF
ncbi:MAG: metalloprotease family protein [Peptococcaceae bacterium]|nr:metalloprotease family protein [Peptococcaceae bacterium]